MLTLDDIKGLGPNDVICIPRPNQTPERWRVNGRVQVWKTQPNRVHVPLKHGLYAYGFINDVNMGTWNALGAYISKGGV